MKKISDKYIVVGADFAGLPLKEAIISHLKKNGWKIEDIGYLTTTKEDDPEMMFHRVGFRLGSKISEGEYERALGFCGTGMGIHIAASKCPHVFSGVVESVPAAKRAAQANGVNVLCMGAFYVAPKMGCDIVDEYLKYHLGEGYENYKNFYEYHKLALDEIEMFDYEKFKKNGFKVNYLGNYHIE